MDAEGNQRHVKDADAKLVEREKEGVHPGKVMAILAGTHAGLMCQVLALEPKASSWTIPVTCRICMFSTFSTRDVALEDRRLPCARILDNARLIQRGKIGIGSWTLLSGCLVSPVICNCWSW